MKIINVVAAVIKQDDKILIAKRGYGEFKGMYEFPGGKIEIDEKSEEALKREILEELNIHIEVDQWLCHVHYDYPNFILEMDCFVCHLIDHNIELLEHMDYKWIDPNNDLDITWVPADIHVIEEIRNKGL